MIFSLVCFKLYCSANFFFLGAPRRQSAAATSRTTQREVNNFFAHAYGLCVPFMIFTFLRFNLYCSANFSFLGAPRSQTRAHFLLDQKVGKKSSFANSRAYQKDSYHYS